MKNSDCIDKGFIVRKNSITKEEIINQLKIAENFIKKAELVYSKDTYDISFMTAYISIFHCARFLLYLKGYKERSHFCLFEFILDNFNEPKIKELSKISQHYREIRHLIQYDGSNCSEELCNSIITDAKEFVKICKQISPV